MKKAQIAGQPFIYILGIAIIVVIVVIGFQGINQILKKIEATEMIDFRDDLSRALKQTRDRGESYVFEHSMPAKYRAVCFRDATKSGGTPIYQAPFVKLRAEDGNNVFLIKNVAPIAGDQVEAFTMTNVSLAEEYVCSELTTYVRFRLVGQGKEGTLVEEMLS